MQHLRRHRISMGRLALWAALVLAIVPTLSRAWAATQTSSAGHWLEVCTAQGLQWRALSAFDPAPATEPDLHAPLDACELCPLAAPGHAALPGPPSLPPVVRATHACPTPVAAPHGLESRWTAAQARAPPTV